MDKKVVFFDLDGTLMNDDKTISPSTEKAVRALQNKGIHTVISTGRAPVMFQEIRNALTIRSYVSMNGQHVVLDGKEVYSNPIDPEVLREFSELAKTNGHGITYSNESAFVMNEAEHPHVLSSLGRLKLKDIDIDEEIYKHSPVHQVQLYCDPRETKEYMDKFSAFSFIRWDECAIDMLPKGASKAIGIQKVLDQLNISKENSYAFGDGPNDFEMLECVGMGVAMGNAIPTLKEAADYVTSSCSEDGIAEGLIAVGLLTRDEIENCRF